MSMEEIYLWLWAGLAIVLTMFSVLVSIWAVKNRKNSDNSHSGLLPLAGYIPDEPEDAMGERG